MASGGSNSNSIIKRGTCILAEEPFAYILCWKYRGKRCDRCFKRNRVSKCSKCQYVSYCNTQCQLEDWSFHKYECKYLKKLLPQIVIDDTTRIIIRILLKLRNGGDQEKSYYTKDCYRKFEDLLCHGTYIQNDHAKLKSMHYSYNLLKSVLGDKIAPNLSDLLNIFGRLQINAVSITDDFTNFVGTGLYLGASILQHSCTPNAERTFEGTKLHVNVTEDQQSLDWSKICVSYIDLLNTPETRKEILYDRYYFTCSCSRCLNPNEIIEMNAAACLNKSCDAFIDIANDKKCPKCKTEITDSHRETYRTVMNYTKDYLNNMKKKIIHCDLYRVCLKKQDGILHPFNVWHIKTLEEAFISALTNGKVETSEYAARLIPGIKKYRGEWNPTMVLLYRIVGKSKSEAHYFKEALHNFKLASSISEVIYGKDHSFYRDTMLPLLIQAVHDLKKS